jgi:hypothetical protein
MLSKEQIDKIAIKANKKVDLPIVGEKFEHKMLIFGLEKIDKILDEQLPADFAKLLDDVSDGFEPGTPADLDKVKNHLVSFLNKKIDLPILGEKGEKELFNVAIDIIIDAMRKNDKL